MSVGVAVVVHLQHPEAYGFGLTTWPDLNWAPAFSSMAMEEAGGEEAVKADILAIQSAPFDPSDDPE